MRYALSLIAACFAVPAYANCGPTADVVALLTDRYGEAEIMSGLTENGVLVQAWGSRETETWTVTLTGADGTTCIVSYGDTLTVRPFGAPA